MTRTRRILAACAIGASASLALATTDCATATEIVIDVTSEACPPGKNGKVVKSTGIAVGTAKTIADARDSAVKDGCEAGDRVGTLTIYPSGDNDEEVTFRVVSAIDRPLDQCKTANPPYDGCITQHRTMRFEPRTRQRVIVRMSLLCLGVVCPAGKTCDNGVCVDGTAPPVADGAVPDGTLPVEAGQDGEAGVDAGPAGGCDPAKCTGGAAVGCNGAVCVVDCTAGGPAKCAPGVNVCPADQDCRVLCGDAACGDLTCNTRGTCTVLCTGAGSCTSVKCTSARCALDCSGDGACDSVRTAGGEATFQCPKKTGGAEAVCGAIACTSARCALTCDGNGCAGTHKCCAPAAPACTGSWDAPIPTTCP